MQTTSHILMVRPVKFVFNAQTAVNNAFQVAGTEKDVQDKALKEFDDFTALLRSRDIDVTIVNDTPEPHTPDSLFPNNWISFHTDGTICLYPMFALNRRLERKPAILETITQQFAISRTLDFSAREKEERFLEGTGSMTLDRDNNIAYAVLSPRTDPAVLKEFCEAMHFAPLPFHAVDERGYAIYHTNVMMCAAQQYVVICLDSIQLPQEKKMVVEAIENSGKQIIEISFSQMNHFAGNMLQVNDKNNNQYVVMSTQAFQSLHPSQVKKLEKYNPIIHSSLEAIETNGGGSARCMMAEIFLPLL